MLGVARRVLPAAVMLLCAAVVVPTGAKADPPKSRYYVSLGDSCAMGYQPAPGPLNRGFADQTVTKARKHGYSFDLVNFGCGGATTSSILHRKGCTKERRAPGAKTYGPLTQVQAATRFLRHHRGQVGLVTVSIGGNDVTACASRPDAIPCVAAAVQAINVNVATLMHQVRRAAGPKVRIVGTTYPDVLLGLWVRQPVSPSLAQLSTVAFKQLINPALKTQYEAVGARFVDVTAATGAYGPMDRTTKLPWYGRVPVPVARVCELTWFCEKADIHPHTKGYSVIADLIVKTLPRRRRRPVQESNLRPTA
jgi:lysophospholipase L1-like esterase